MALEAVGMEGLGVDLDAVANNGLAADLALWQEKIHVVVLAVELALLLVCLADDRLVALGAVEARRVEVATKPSYEFASDDRSAAEISIKQKFMFFFLPYHDLHFMPKVAR